MRKFWLFPWLALPAIFRLLLKTYEELLIKKGMKGFTILVVALVVFWHVYVPFHELFHVFGCWISGGEVTELALKAQYGGTLLKPIFPFIVADSDYAGQLTGFTTPNDFAYFVVDMFPYLLSLPGIALFVSARRRVSPVLFALAVVLALTPFFSIPGDFYEAVSLGTARVASWFDPQLEVRTLLSDDIFSLLPQLKEAGHMRVIPLIFFGLGVLGAIYVCLLCLVSQLHLAKIWFGEEAVLNVSLKQDSPEGSVQVMTTQLES